MKLDYAIWRQRREASIKSPWGYMYEVYSGECSETIASGWRATCEEGYRGT